MTTLLIFFGLVLFVVGALIKGRAEHKDESWEADIQKVVGYAVGLAGLAFILYAIALLISVAPQQ